MISKLTQLLGEMCLILSKNRTAYRYAVVKKSRPLNSRTGGKFSQFLLILLISFIGFADKAIAQCVMPDVEAPSAICFSSITVALDSDGMVSLTPQNLDDGSFDACGIMTFSVDIPGRTTTDVVCSDIGNTNLIASLTVTDAAGNSNSCDTEIIVIDNLAPSISCPANMTVDCGESTSVADLGDATAMDNCGLASVTSSDMQGMASNGNCATISRTFEAIDNFGNTNTCVQTINVIDNQDPVLDFGMGVVPPRDTILSCSEIIPPAPTATMTDDCTPSATITATVVNSQGGNTLSCDFYNYTITRTWTAMDNCGRTDVHVQVIAIENEPLFTNAPTTLNLSANSTANCPNACSSEINLDLTNDVDYNCNLGGQLESTGYSLEDAAGNIVYSSGNSLHINSICLPVGVYNANFSATDFCGNTTTHTVVVTIADNQPPNAVCFNDISVAVPSVGMYVIDPAAILDNGSSDNCATQLSYSVDIPTLDCTAPDQAIGDVVTVTMTVSDGTLTSTCTTNITILDNPPAPFCQDITVEVDAAGNYTVQAMDIDAGSMDQCNGPLSYMISIDTMDYTTDLVLDCSNIGIVPAVLQVTDSGTPAMSAICYANITVEDNEDPQAICGFTSYPVTLNNDGMYTFTLADTTNFETLFSDNCDFNFAISPVSFDCDDVDVMGGVDVTLTVVDNNGMFVQDTNGDSINCVVNIDVSDTTPPLIDCADITVSVDGSGDVTLRPEDVIGGTLFLQSGDNGSGTLGFDQICITIANATTLSFDYTYTSTDPRGPDADNFRYLLNGIGFQIAGSTVVMPSPVSINVNAGDQFCLQTATTDNLDGSATIVVDNFNAGLLGDFAIANWNTPNKSNSDGDIFFNDACGIDNYQIRCVGDPMWSDSLSYDCDDLEAMFGGTQTCGPQTKEFEVRAFDVHGNITLMPCTSEVTFIDKQPPVPVCDSKTISLSTGAVTVPANLFDDGSYDACGIINVNRYAIARPGDGIFQEDLTFDCDSIGTFPIIFRVEDCSGNEAFCATTITVQENQPPKIHCSPDVTIDCSEVLTPNNTGFPTLVMDACSANVDTTYADVVNGLAITCSVIERTWTATDASGNQSSCLQMITVEDNMAPTFTTPADITLENCENPDNFLITGFPTDIEDNCSIRPGASYHDAGFVDSYAFSGSWVISTNGNSTNSSVSTFGTDSLQIFSGDDFPCAIMPAADVTETNMSINIPFSGELKFAWCYVSSDGSDPLDDPFGYILNGTFTQLSGSASTQTGTTTITVAAGDVFEFSQQTLTNSCGGATTTIKNFRGPEGCTSSFIRTFAVFDECENTNIQEQVITLDVTSAPTITFPDAFQAVSGGTGSCTGPATIDFSSAVTGNCGGIDITNDALANFGIGDGMSIASGNYPVGTSTVTFTVSSSLGCFATETHTVEVTVVDGTSPFLQCTQSIQNVILNSAGQGVLSVGPGIYTASDDCGIQSVVVDPVNFTCADIGMTPNVTLTVSDGANVTSCNLNVNVIASTNTTLTCPPDVTVDCAAFGGLTANFGSPTVGGVCGNNAAFVEDNSIISGTFNDCLVFERTWSDGSNSCIQTITVEDNMAPVLDPVPNDTILAFSNPNLPVSLNFTDNCASAGSVTSTDDHANQDNDQCSCGHYNYDLIRNWVASDNCGNMDSGTQIITLVDDAEPTFTFPDTLFVQNDPATCGAQIDFNLADFVSDDAPFSCLDVTNDALNGDGQKEIDGFYPVGIYEIEFVVEDPCGNAATETLILEVVDSESFSLTCFSFIDLNLDNTGNGTITANQILDGPIVDNCTPSNNFTLSVAPSTFNCTNIGPFNTSTLTVTDQNGNQNTCTVTVNVFSTFINLGFQSSISSTPASNILAADGTATVTASGGSGSFNFQWDDANAQTTATATGLVPGLYSVTITDANTGCIHVEETVVASVCPTFNVGQADGGFSDMVSIPVTVDDFTNLVSFQYTLNVNTTVAQFTGTSNYNIPGLSASNFSVMSAGSTMTVSWIDPGGMPGTTLPAGTTLFTIDLVINGAPGNSSIVYINSTPVNFEIGQFLNGNAVDVPGCTNDGSVSVNTSLALAQVCGNIATENGTPVENVEVTETLSGTADTTDVNGDYCISVAPGTPVCVEPFKNNNHFGSSSIDLYLIQQHILGNTLLSTPYQIIAADANNSGSVSTLDLVDLQFLILGNFTTLPNNDFWRFVDANQTFTNPMSPFPFDDKVNLGTVNSDFLNTDFVAVAVGDVNGTAQVQMTDGTTALRADNSFDFNLDDQAVKKGTSFDVTFNASELADIAGYQMTLEFETENLQFEAVEAVHIDNLSENNFALNKVTDGIISLNWYGMKTRDFEDNEALFTLKFTALNDIETLQGLLRSTSSVTNAEAYKMTNNQLEYLNVNINFNSQTVKATDFTLYDNRPNPFKYETTIGFTLPNDSETTITVFDVSGKILMQVDRDFYKGYNEMIINASELSSSGIIYYEVKTEENTATGRMILLK